MENCLGPMEMPIFRSAGHTLHHDASGMHTPTPYQSTSPPPSTRQVRSIRSAELLSTHSLSALKIVHLIPEETNRFKDANEANAEPLWCSHRYIVRVAHAWD